MTLPTNIDVTYGDDAGDASVKAHQQHHDAIHAFVNSGGSSQVPIAKTSAYTASSGDAVLANASGGDFTVTLPAPSLAAKVTVKNVGASGTVTVARHGSEHIDGAAANFIITTGQLSRDFLSDGTDWWMV